jgi:hypothetical protein
MKKWEYKVIEVDASYLVIKVNGVIADMDKEIRAIRIDETISWEWYFEVMECWGWWVLKSFPAGVVILQRPLRVNPYQES